MQRQRELAHLRRVAIVQRGDDGMQEFGADAPLFVAQFDLACGVLHGLSDRRVEASIGKGRLVRGSGTRRSPACESRRGRCAT